MITPNSVGPKKQEAVPSALLERDQKIISEELVQKLIPPSFDLEQGRKIPRTQVVQDIFISDKELSEVVRAIILEKCKPEMDEKEKSEAVAIGLQKVVEKRYAERDKLIHESDLKDRPQHLKALVKAREYFASHPEATQLALEFSGEREDDRYLASVDPKTKEVHVILFLKVEALGEGATATVHKVLDVQKNTFLAFKKAKASPLDRAHRIKQFAREAERLKTTDKTILFINDSIIGFTSTLKDVDLSSVISETSEPLESEYADIARSQDRLQYIKDIAAEQHRLQDQHVFLTDLKPENIMLQLKTGKEQAAEDRPKASVKLIDLADAADLGFKNAHGEIDRAKVQSILEEIRSWPPAGPGTTTYTTYADFIIFKSIKEKAMKLTSDAPVAEIESFLKEYQAALEQRITFTLGMTCYLILTSKSPFSMTPKEGCLFPNPEAPMNEQALRDKGYSEQVIEVLKKMMHPDPSKRPSANETYALIRGFKFLSQGEIDKLEPSIGQNLKDEAQAIKVSRHFKLSTLDSMIAESRELCERGPMYREKGEEILRKLENCKNLLIKLPTLRKENQELTDLNPFVNTSEISDEDRELIGVYDELAEALSS